MTDQSQQTKVIHAYSIFEYTQKIEEAISEGYSFKLLTNEGTPQQFGFHYEVTMYKVPEIDYQELDKTEPITEETCSTIQVKLESEITKGIAKVQPQKQRGRPSVK